MRILLLTIVYGVSCVVVPVKACASLNVVLHLGASILLKGSTPGVLDRCSVGLKAKDSSGRDGFITAGHCAHAAGQIVYIKYRDHKVPVGKMVEFVPYRNRIAPDFGFVVLRHDDMVSASVDHSIPDVGEVTGIYRGVIPYGSIICKRGSTSGITCGRVVASGLRFAYFGNRDRVGSGQKMSVPGDSGGVVFYKDGASGAVVVVGIVTDYLIKYFHGIPLGFGVVQMIADIEKVLKVTIV